MAQSRPTPHRGVALDILSGLTSVIINACTENWYNLETRDAKVLLDRTGIDVQRTVGFL